MKNDKNLSYLSGKKWLVVVFLIAFFLRLGMNIVFQGINSSQDPSAGTDYYDNQHIAENLFAGKGFSYQGKDRPLTTRLPGVPAIIASVYAIFGMKYYNLRIFYSLLGAGACIVLYFSLIDILGSKYALLSSFLLAIYPQHFYYSMHFGTEVPITFVLCCVFLLFQCFLKRTSYKLLILFGLSMGLTAYISAQFMLLPFCFIVTSLMFIRKLKNKMGYTYLVLPVVISVLTMVPWMVRNSLIEGKFTLMSGHGGQTLLDGNNIVTYYDIKYMGKNLNQFLFENPGYMDLASQNSTIFLKNDYRIKKKENIGERMDPDNQTKMKEETIQFIIDNWYRLPLVSVMKLYRMLTPITTTPNYFINIVFTLSWGILLPFTFVGLIASLKKEYTVFLIPLYANIMLLLFITLVFFGLQRYRSMILPTQIVFASIGIREVCSRLNTLYRSKYPLK